MNLLVEKKDGIGRITLNRPDVRNAFDDALISELARAFQAMDQDAAVRVVVLAGNGPAFCAGADLNWMKRMASYGYDENLRDARALAEMLATLDCLDKPTIARVHGPAFAGGSEAHARIKDLIRDVAGRPVDDGLKGDTARRIAQIRSSPEGREGIASFLE